MREVPPLDGQIPPYKRNVLYARAQYYDVEATDPEGDTLTYSLTVSPSGMTINSTTGLIGWTPDAAGDAPVTVQVTDNKAVPATQSFTVTVAAALVPVPDVVGQTRAAAESAIIAADLTVGTVTEAHSDTVPAGQVISQNPSAASTVTQGTAVNLVVSLGPAGGGNLPPDPATDAPPTDPTVATDVAAATAFLYTGASPIQTGVTCGIIEARRVAVLRGKVTSRDGTALPAVKISVLGHSELGQTLTRADGAFDLAVNGGGQLTLRYEKEGFLDAQRAIVAPWRDYAWLPDVVMIPFDTAVTAINLSAATNMQTARGSPVSDADGARRATILFPQDTIATMVLPDGTTQPLTTLKVRATEYTVGDSGPKAMPAPLPPSSGYTYAAEFSVDEAVDAGATDVRFSQALPMYVENFLGFPVGGAVPTGYYDRQKGQWIASANGRVIKVMAIANGVADLDTDGDDVSDDAAKLTALGVTAEERARLAQLYTSGQTLWRTPITHFTPWDFNWPYGPPPDAVPPPGPNPNNPPVDDPCEKSGSIIGCENQTLGESVSVSGTPWRLHYRSDRTPGRKDAYTLNIPVSGATIPASLRAIRVEVSIARRLFKASFAPAPNLTYTVTWDDKDGYGRPLQGAQPAGVQVHYDYAPQYYAVRSDFTNSFARAEAAGVAVSRSPEASIITLSKAWTERVGGWNATAAGLGGWSLSIQHVYHPNSRTLLLGNGRQRRSETLSSIITTLAGDGRNGSTGDGGPATQAQIAGPHDVTVGPDGSLYIAELGGDRIRKVTPDGVIRTVAGRGPCTSTDCFSGDGGPATQAQLRFPHGVAVTADGTLYIADDINNRIRRLSPGGTIATIAGNGQDCTLPCAGNGDGGPAAAAIVTRPNSLELAPDGSLYFLEQFTNRIRRIGPDGIVTTVAGGGTDSENGVPATSARFELPTDLAVGPDGSLYVSDWLRHKVRRITPDGLIFTVVGTGRPGNGIGGRFGGDGGPATEADLSQPYGVAVAPDGTLYVADEGNRRLRRVGADGIITTIAGSGDPCTSTAAGNDCLDDGPAGPRGSTWGRTATSTSRTAPTGSERSRGRYRVTPSARA